MSTKPNNFPREGQHNTVTRDGLEALEAARPVPNESLDYTIGGATQAIVHSNIEADRNYALHSGYQRLEQVSEHLNQDYPFSALDGFSKAQFNHEADTAGYADAERKAAMQPMTREPEYER